MTVVTLSSVDNSTGFNAKLSFFFSPHFSSKTSIEAIHGLMSQVIKNKLFNQVGGKETT